MQRDSHEIKALRRFSLPECEPSKTCFFAGQKLTKENAANAKERLSREIGLLLDRGVNTFISGGSPGFELDAAEAVLAFRKRRPSLRLFFVLPFPDYFLRWKAQEEVPRLQSLLGRADAQMYVGERPGACRHRAVCIVYYTAHGLCALQGERQSAAAQTVSYAIQRDCTVKNLVENSTLLERFLERENAFRRAAGQSNATTKSV